jgi:hypothetical protein
MDETHITTGGEAPAPRPPAPLPEREPVTLDRLPYHPYETRRQDKQYLGLLAVFHFIGGALFFGLALLMLLYVGMGIVFLNMPMPTRPGSPPGPSPVFMGVMFIVLFGFIALVMIAQGALTCLTGYYLQRRKRWLFCMVTSAIVCVHAPIGTALGAFTIVMLMRQSVRDLFQYGEPPSTDEDYE